ncbi:MAG: hypothetical protein V7L00_24440 [Nostoc sp.]|uniref:hypothetical protein n=1 Tax=Nostoc sp. TaxID=1180 RepID=UPI002FFD12C2
MRRLREAMNRVFIRGLLLPHFAYVLAGGSIALDSAKEEIETIEKAIQDTSERLVSGVAFKYGKDSREYEMTGGVRKSDACGGLRLRIRKVTITRLKSTADLKAASKQTA